MEGNKNNRGRGFLPGRLEERLRATSSSRLTRIAKGERPALLAQKFLTTRRPEERLPASHFLRHEQQEFPVGFIERAEDPAQAAQEMSFFAGSSPRNLGSGLTLWEIGQLRGFFAVVEELIKGDFKRPGHFFERFDGRHSMAILYAGNVATQQPGALFNVPL